MKIEVKHATKTVNIEVADTATLGELKTAIAKETKVPVSMQKLMGKPNLKDDAKPLSELGFKDGAKLMLIGNPVEEVIGAHGDSREKEKRAKEVRSLPAAFWALPPFAGMLADPYVEGRGRPVEHGTAALSLLFMDVVLGRVNTLGTNMTTLAMNEDATNSFDHPFLTLAPNERAVLSRAHSVIRKSLEFASNAQAAKEPEEVLLLVQGVISSIKGLSDNEWMLVPSGWVSLTYANVMYFLIRRNPAKPQQFYTADGSGDTYELVVINTDPNELGCLDFHPQIPTSDSIKAKACMSIPNISKERITDEAFWLLTLSLFIRANQPDFISEFARGEVIYDVLLPWLYEANPEKDSANPNAANPLPRDLSTLFANNKQLLAKKAHADPQSDAVTTPETATTAACTEDFVTPQRSGSGATRALVAALAFLLRQFGMGAAQVKQLKFVLRYEFFLRAAEDLLVAAKRHLPPSATVKSPSSPKTPVTPSATAAQSTGSAAPTTSRKATGTPTPATQPLPVQRLVRAIDAMTDIGIEASTTNPTLSALFQAMGPRDYIKTASNVLLPTTHFDNKVVAVYFSASWCAPCRKFGPLVTEVYNRLLERIPDAKNKIEFLLINLDREKEKADEYCAKFPFPRMSWPPDDKVGKTFDLSAIPTFLIFAPDGSLMTRDGVSAVRQDPEAIKFPHAPWNGALALTSTDLRMFEFASATLSHHGLKKFEQGKINEEQLKSIRDVITVVKGVADVMPRRDDNGKEGSLLDVEEPDASVLPIVDSSQHLSVPDVAANATNSGLLNRVSTVKYAGTPYASTVPNLGDLSNFKIPSDYASLHAMLRQAAQHVDALWERARHSGTSSRVAVQMQIIEFISWLFTFIIPVPKPSAQQISSVSLDSLPPAERGEFRQFLGQTYHPIRDSVSSDLYDGAIPAGTSQDEDIQFRMCEAIYKMMLSYATAWQAVETPSRAFDSERPLVCVAMLCCYDAIARSVTGANKGLIMAILLTSDGGYHMSTSMCKHTVSFKEASATFELTRPQHLAVRDALITLINFNRLRYPNELYDLRVPDHIELRKHSHTVNFLRKFLENCGYKLSGGEDEEDAQQDPNQQQQQQPGGRGGRGRGGRTQAERMGGTEMEKLMFWMCDHRSPLASEHPEFVMHRDMALLTKFLSTMEMRDTQLLRKRKTFDEFASWYLSFEEDAPGRQMSAGWRTKPRPPMWDCLLVRGRDMDIADISVKGFGDRAVSTYGEGLCVVSPIDATAQLGIECPLEEDVLHAKSLPTFGGVLSQEESEGLWSVLTVPYMRIPLVLDFFSTQDRHTYLFAAPMQALLRSTLFEPGAHIPLASEDYNTKFNVPMRLSSQQRQEAQIAMTMSATAEGDTTRFLGSSFGLLINELQHSPQPVLGPWMSILGTTRDLGPSSIYSVNATYALFLCSVTCDLLSFVHYTLTMESDSFECRHGGYLASSRTAMSHQLDELLSPLLLQWLAEAEENDDIPTQCVVHSHMAMVQRALSLGQPIGDQRRKVMLVRLLQSCAFVRARHGFGMGFQRTQLASQEGDNSLTPEDKLLRFLQAQGLDTRATNKAMLEQGRKLMMSGGRRRAVFVQIRGRNHSDTVRVPNLFRSDPTSTAESKALKLPPVDVPENLLFAILQEHFFELSGFVNALPMDSPSTGFPSAASAADLFAGGEGEGTPNMVLDTVANAIVKTVLKDKVSLAAAAAPTASSPTGASPKVPAAATWIKSAGGVLTAPASSLVFHLQTCELFWKDEELKPVPDSMSHYDDYETILGRDIVQCGLVSRSENRHWVHVVGTVYDLIEWTDHDPADQGVHCPVVAMGPPEAEDIQHVVYLGENYTRPVNVYDEDPWPEREERWAVKLVQQLYQAAFPGGSMKYSPIMPEQIFKPTQPAASEGAEAKQVLMDEIRMVCNDKAQYEEEEVKATWKEIVATRQVTIKRLAPGKKVLIPGPYEGYEVVDTDVRLDIYTLVPHARKIYRVLHYSTSQRTSLAALELIKSKRAHNENFKTLRYQVGRLKNRVKNEGTLEIHRYNTDIGGREVYVPPRLLQGIIPSCLLENLLFWHGEDDIIRGYPGSSGAAAAALSLANANVDEGAKKGQAEAPAAKTAEKNADLAKAAGEAFANHWFNYSVELELGPGYPTLVSSAQRKAAITHGNLNNLPLGSFRLIRRADKKHRNIREPTASSTSVGMARSDSETLSITADIDAKSLSTLRTLFNEYPDMVLAYAFKQGKRNVGKAVDWISDVANSEAIQAMMPETSSPTASAPTEPIKSNNKGMPGRANSMGGSITDLVRANTGVAEGNELEVETDENLELLRLSDCPELSQLAKLLLRIEDSSHILVWGRKLKSNEDADNDNAVATADGFEIQIIELPRLRAKFQPKTEDGQTHLWLVDNPGWRVALPKTEIFNDQRTIKLLDPWEQCIVLRNVTTSELAFFVPNHDFARMDVEGDPFNRLLLFDRGSVQWMESVPSPFYLMLVHTSREFLVAPSLAASLYAAVIFTARQRYAEAFRYVESCYVDTPFTIEERFMFSLMARTLTSSSGSGKDNHPDAHAARLKFAHSALYSTNEVEWPLELEVTKYLLKRHHVSRCCRLTREELTDLLKRCRRATPIVKCQLEYWVQQRQGRSSAKITPPQVEKAGRPWAKMKAMTAAAVSSTCSKITRLQYKDPKKLLHDDALVTWLWDDALLQDEESGANSDLGFFFLYSLLRKKPQCNMKLLGKDVSTTMGSLLTRWFQLRHARWGKEFSGGGEAELIPSYMMAALSDVESSPNAAWPSLTDVVTLGFMSRGGVSVNQQINASNNRSWGRLGDVMMNGGGGDDGFGVGANNGPTPLATFVRNLERCVQDVRRGGVRALPNHPTPERVSVKAFDYVIPRVSPSDTAQEVVHIRGQEGGAASTNGSNTVPAFSARTAASMATFLFEEIGIFENFINVLEPKKTAADGNASSNTNTVLPFDVSQHPLAQSHVAKDMLRRLEADVNTFEDQRRSATQYLLKMLEAANSSKVFEPLWSGKRSADASAAPEAIASSIQTIVSSLSQLVEALVALNNSDNMAVEGLAEALMGLANGIHTPAAVARLNDNDNASSPSDGKEAPLPFQVQALIHEMNRAAGSRNQITIEWLCGALLSSTFEQDLAAMNPLHGDPNTIRSYIIQFMMLSNRSYFGAQTVGVAQQLLRFMEMLQALGRCVYQIDDDGSTAEEREARLLHLAAVFSVDHDTNLVGKDLLASVAQSTKGRFHQLTGALSEQVSVKRHYIEQQADGSYALDPRFLCFEFIFSIILRSRQVEMIRWFKSNTDSGNSRVQQMIMGQGKTTVVGPILALMLADGKSLVTQVMPTALLEQSRNVLRKCFSVIIPKRIFTLQFDRGVEDSEDVIESLFQKLRSAQLNRSVVVSAPESIKALFLKYIEQLHALESLSDTDLMGGGGGARRLREAKLLKNKAVARSKMADAIVPILNMWRNGVLIMDEVDVLLHPLRSELNFPIGLKHPIELSGARWLLPIHILDGIFYMSRGRAAGTLAAASSAVKGNIASPSAETPTVDDEAEETAALEGLRRVIQKGIEAHTIQREPHVVLLDNAFYHSSMKEAVAQWAMLWLWRTISKEQNKAKRQADRQAKLAELSQLQRQVDDDNANPALDAATTQPTRGPALNITKSSFTKIAHAFLIDSRGLSASTNESNGYEALLKLGSEMSASLLPTAIQLLFLARDWLDTLLPHVLSKINRVGYGILQPNDFAALSMHGSGQQDGSAGANAGMPLSRKLMAIPFVAKDVPSRSSEFAHPDVVIGLTVLAYRYEGLRKNDVKELLLQLKQDYSRQTGPRERRPAAMLYNAWMTKARADRERSGHVTSTSATDDAYANVPLSQLQVLDPTQLQCVYNTLKSLPEAAHYFLCQHTFPRTMNFQKLKLSACGHELASSILFGKRIGFSGTPSNLLPLDMGACEYEPGSDGKILNVLTDPAITTCDALDEGWTPIKVLHRIATANPPFHALIDTGALITNMDNEQVARYLMEYLPASFEGVVFLDASDKQVVLQRNNMQIVPLSQCGVALSRRFTFFDQVHTTGMDIKQSPTATAVVTIGKDMVFRDYAQGAFRMRGIGKGQRIRLFLIPEVAARVKESLVAYDPSAATKSNTINIPAWLLLNAMRIEGLQFVKLSSQELENIWRKLALKYLIKDSDYGNSNASTFTDLERVHRFSTVHPSEAANASSISATRDARRGPVPSDFLTQSIASFREAIGFPVADHIDAPVSYSDKVRHHFDAKPQDLLFGPLQTADSIPNAATGGDVTTGQAVPMDATTSDEARAPDQQSVDRIDLVMHRMMTALDVHGQESDEMNLNAEVVHEQEAEEEQEQEAEQEEQRISAFTRDDEQQIGWDVRVINPHDHSFASGSSASAAESPFYLCSQFQIRPEQPKIAVPSFASLSDNFYRKRWTGLGERKLRNCVVFVQWVLSSEGSTGEAAKVGGSVITLAEGETLRWLLHHNSDVQAAVPISIRIVGSGRYVEASQKFRDLLRDSTSPASASKTERGALYASECKAEFLAMDRAGAFFPSPPKASDNDDNDNAAPTTTTSSTTVPKADTIADPIALWFRFYNNDMFYTPEELHTLETRVLADVSLPDRVSFFMECLRLRRRHRNDFADAPIADLFTADEDRDELKDIAELKKLEVALLRFAKAAEAEAKKAKENAGPKSPYNDGIANPDFMTEEEQLQHLLANTHPDNTGAASSEGQGTSHVNPFMATLRSTLKAAVAEAIETKFISVGNPTYSEHTFLTPTEAATALRKAMTASVKESVAASKKRAAEGVAVAPPTSEGQSSSAAKTSDEGVATNVRLPSSLNAIDLEAAMTRVQSILLERALAEAAAKAREGQSGGGSSSHHAHKITYATLIDVLPVLHPEYEAIEANKASATKAAKKVSKASPWNCPSCTFQNPAALAQCGICHAPRPAGLGGDAGAEDDDDEANDGVPAQWNCPACTFLNEATSLECGICNTQHPNPPKTKGKKAGGADGGAHVWEREIPQGHWVCSTEHGGCSMYNPDNWYYCRACDKARPNLASLRF